VNLDIFNNNLTLSGISVNSQISVIKEPELEEQTIKRGKSKLDRI